MPRTSYRASEGNRFQYPTMPYHPHPHIIICTSFLLINWLQRFYRITMWLKRPFVPKSDVKQWFTTTTTTLDVCACLGESPLDMPSSPYQVSEGKPSQQPTMPYHPPSRHHLYIIHLISMTKGLFLSCYSTVSLKWPWVPRIDLRQ